MYGEEAFFFLISTFDHTFFSKLDLKEMKESISSSWRALSFSFKVCFFFDERVVANLKGTDRQTDE